MENAISDAPDLARRPDVASRIASATAARHRRPDYTVEVHALLDAARKVIAATGRARVADIVAEAGLSNDAFYRHFSSKDALVAALSEQGAEHVAGAIARRMEGESSPEAKIRCWLDGMLAQTAKSNAEPTLAVLSVSSNFNTAIPTGDHAVVRAPLAGLLGSPFAAVGSPNPKLDAELVTHAISNLVAGHLWSGTTPTAAEAEYLAQFCLSTARH